MLADNSLGEGVGIVVLGFDVEWFAYLGSDFFSNKMDSDVNVTGVFTTPFAGCHLYSGRVVDVNDEGCRHEGCDPGAYVLGVNSAADCFASAEIFGFCNTEGDNVHNGGEPGYSGASAFGDMTDGGVAAFCIAETSVGGECEWVVEWCVESVG